MRIVSPLALIAMGVMSMGAVIRDEVGYLVLRMKQELGRNKGVLRPDELGESRQALAIYQGIAAQAR